MKKRWTAILLLLCLLLSFCAPALADSIKVYVSDNTLKVYEKATSSSKLLGTMTYGESMTCTEISDSWAKVKNSDGDVGFCKKSGLTTDNPNTMDDEVRIRKTGVKVYKKASSSSDVMFTVSEDTLENVYIAVAKTEDGDWIRLKNGKHYGYVKAKYVIDADEGDAPEEEVPDEEGTFNDEDENFDDEQPDEDGSFNDEDDSFDDEQPDENGSFNDEDESFDDEQPDEDGTFNDEDESFDDEQPDEAGSFSEEVTPDEELPEEEPSEEENPDAEMTPEDEAPEDEEVPGEEIPEEQPQTIYIIKNTLKVYKKTSSSSSCLGVMSYGEDLILLEEDGKWAKVQNASGDVGYCRVTGISGENPNSMKTPAVTKRSSVKVYKRADDDSSVLVRLGKGIEMTVLSVFDDEDWARVQLADGTKGYVLMKYLELGEEPAPDQSETEDSEDAAPDQGAEAPEEDGSGNTVAAIIALAKAQLGDPYVYAASGPDSFDCSGFVYYCFREITGIKLSRTAYSQGYNEKYPKIESASDLQAGDLVFFNTNSGDSDLSDHSGIYIGGSKFIHASSAAAKVITSNLSSGYYQDTFSWGRRVL